ncbi:MAG: hypothetical protein VW378_04965 [bacterium]
MPLVTILVSLIILLLCCVGLGIGVLFFGKKAERTPCGSVPKLKTDPCPSQKAGLCPIEDKDGYVKILNQTRLNSPDRSIS